MVADSAPPSSDAADAPSRCTGPRTAAGKARSAMNALTHGLTARTPLLPGEDAGEFLRFVWDVVEDLAPDGPVQGELASRAAQLMWKRRRIGEAERQVMEELTAQYSEDQEEAAAEAEGQRDAAAEDPSRIARLILADEFASKPDQLDRLEQYEHRIARQIESTIRLLLKLQNRKDWREGAQDRREASLSEQGQEPARPAAHRGAPSDAPEPAPALPPAPAQNELAPALPNAPKTAPGGDWTGPPGVN